MDTDNEFEMALRNERIAELKELMKQPKNETISVRISADTLDLIKASLDIARIDSATEFLRVALTEKLLGITVAESVLQLIHKDIAGSKFMEAKVNDSITKMGGFLGKYMSDMATLIHQNNQNNTKSIELIASKLSDFVDNLEQ